MGSKALTVVDVDVDAVHVMRITHFHFEMTWLASTIQLRYTGGDSIDDDDDIHDSTYIRIAFSTEDKNKWDKIRCSTGINARSAPIM